MIRLDKHIRLTIFIIICISVSVFYIKPSLMFTDTGDFKHFGVGDKRHKTIFPFWFVMTTIGFMVYYVMITCNSDYL